MEYVTTKTTYAFQSTRPLRGATILRRRSRTTFPISIHAPLAGRDAALARARQTPAPISIHAPLAGRDRLKLQADTAQNISIHAPLAGRDQCIDAVAVRLVISIHAPLAGRDNAYIRDTRHAAPISIHAPLAGRDSKFDEFLSANLHKSNKRDLLSEEKMRHSLPQTAHVSHFRSFFGAKLQRFSARLPFALRS